MFKGLFSHVPSVIRGLCFCIMSGMVSVVMESEQIVVQLLFSNLVHKKCDFNRGVVNKMSVET